MFFSFKMLSIWLHIFAAMVATYLIGELLIIDYSYAWFAGISLVAFFSFGRDKLASKLNWGRTPEMTFHIVGLLGGFPGIFAGRTLFRHKTSKLAFIIPMWILFVCQVLFVAYAFGGLDKVVDKWQEAEQMNAQQQNSQ